MAGNKKKGIVGSDIEKLLESVVIKRGDNEEFAFGRVQFGIPILDELVGGGIPRKRISLITGQSSAGKSYLASQIVKTVQNEGGIAAWIDAEMTWDANWMEACGINIHDVLVSQPESGEVAFDIIRQLMQNKVDVIILDSIAGLIPASFNEEDFSHNPMAWQSRLVNSALPRLMNNLKYGTALVFINQTRSSMGPVSLDPMPGGMGQVYFSHIILQVRRGEWIKDAGEERVGYNIEVRQRKSKVGGASYGMVTIPFRLKGGIDIMELYINEFVDNGLVKKSGVWFKIVGEEKQHSGKNGLKKYLIENSDVYNKLREDLEKIDNKKMAIEIEESEVKDLEVEVG